VAGDEVLIGFDEIRLQELIEMAATRPSSLEPRD